MYSPKVAHVTTIDLSLRHLLLNQIKSLQQAGYKVAGVSTSGPHVQDLQAAGIEHRAVSISRTVSPLKDLWSLWRLSSLFRREQFTIVHTHNPKPGLLGQIAAKMAGTPIVVNTVHGFYFHEHMKRAYRNFYVTLERIAARCSDVVLFQSQEDVDTAISIGIAPHKIKYLGNGIDVESFSPSSVSSADLAAWECELGFRTREPVVGFVGRLAAKRKGFMSFLKAVQYVAAQIPNVHFLIVGEADGGKADAVEPEVAEEFGIADRCIFLGHLPNDELPALYSIMNVLVLPSLFEGVPRSVMEAAAMGVPAVVTNVKGNREAVEHDRNGLLVPLGDVQALTSAILELLRDKEKAQRLGEGGRRLAEERFDEQRVFAKVKAEYARLLQEKGLPVPNGPV